MKNIYLTELVDEILGVPEGIIETAQEIYEGIIKEIKDNYPFYSLVKEGSITFTLSKPGGYKIADYIFKEVEMTVSVQPVKEKEIYWIGMGFSFGAALDKPYKRFKYTSPTDSISVDIKLATNIFENTWSDIANYLAGDKKTELMASLAHELKHSYDKFKKKGEPALGMIKYRTTSELMQPMPGLREFMFYSYFTTLTENLVRATEVASYLKYKGTTKKEFLNILKETQVYQNAKKAQEFTYEGMLQMALSDPRVIPAIEEFFKEEGEDISKLSDIEKVKKLLKHHFIAMKDHMSQTYKATVKKLNPALMMFASWGIGKEEVDVEKENAIKEFEKIVNRFSDDNFEKFYQYEIAKINQNANKIIRKVAKLYDYI